MYVMYSIWCVLNLYIVMSTPLVPVYILHIIVTATSIKFCDFYMYYVIVMVFRHICQSCLLLVTFINPFCNENSEILITML